MLLKAWENHEQMSTKGEKQGFSGAIEHWMACKVLKRKGYYLDLSLRYSLNGSRLCCSGAKSRSVVKQFPSTQSSVGRTLLSAAFDLLLKMRGFNWSRVAGLQNPQSKARGQECPPYTSSLFHRLVLLQHIFPRDHAFQLPEVSPVHHRHQRNLIDMPQRRFESVVGMEVGQVPCRQSRA